VAVVPRDLSWPAAYAGATEEKHMSSSIMPFPVMWHTNSICMERIQFTAVDDLEKAQSIKTTNSHSI
jgi:hypothetical protein